MVEKIHARQGYSQALSELRARLLEPAPGRVQILQGPRQLGKTTALLQLAAEWGEKAIYAAADSAEASLPGWWETLWQRAEEKAAQEKFILLLDEIHYLPDWSRRLKAAADRIRREGIPIHVVVTGSSALELGSGSRESLAGRFERIPLWHWPAGEFAETFGWDPRDAARRQVLSGTYPGAQALLQNPARFRSYLREAIVEPAIGMDIQMTETIRKPALFRQVFAIALSHPAEIVSLQKLGGLLLEKGALETLSHYLDVMEKARLVAALPKFTARAVRQRASPPKLVVLQQGMLASMEQPLPPDPELEPARFGRWVENACLAFAANCGQRVAYWREEPHEVDMVMEGSWGRWAVEIKTGPYGLQDLKGLLVFMERHKGCKPLVLCDPGREQAARTLGLEAASWVDFLLAGPP